MIRTMTKCLLLILCSCAIAPAVKLNDSFTRKQSLTFLYRQQDDVSAILDIRMKDGTHREILFKKDGLFNQENKKLGDYPKGYETARVSYEKMLDQIVSIVEQGK